jgi:hypothetical protein
MRNFFRFAFRVQIALMFLLLFTVHVFGQSNQAQSRIVEPIDENNITRISGTTHPLARAEFDQGAVSPGTPAKRMLLVLSRSPEQEAALQQLLAQQQDHSSPNFHQWLTPAQFGQQFGPSDEDIQTITSWLSSHGLQVASVGPGKNFIEFSGTADQVQQTFHTSIHNLNVKGEAHIANMSDVQIPSALAPVIKTVMGLHNFFPRPASRSRGVYIRSTETGESRPADTLTGTGGTAFAIGPADFAQIYNVFPLWAGQAPLPSAVDGTGTTIAIVGTSNINLQDVLSFRTLFGLPTNLPANTPKVILNGPDPGNLGPNSAEGEADLDVEWSGAVAKGAQIVLVVTEQPDTFGVSGNDLSSAYIVNNNIAPIVSSSFLACEVLNAGESTFYTSLWGQAAAQGMTVMVATGDAGPAGCDNFDTESVATEGLSVNAIASTPYNVAVGGTDFDDVGNETSFFNNSNTTSVTPPGFTFLSAKGYIPEIPWNDSCAATGIASCTASTSSNLLDISAGSGGPSALVTKPIWQNGFGSAEIQLDGKRDLPDVSLFASNGGSRVRPSFYFVCESDLVTPPTSSCVIINGGIQFSAVGGTSVASPTFAGMMAMVIQAIGSRLGNANFVLYPLSTIGSNTCSSTAQPGSPSPGCIFYDVTKSNDAVPCAGGSSGCSSTTFGGIGVLVDPASTTNPAWISASGYDRATGLGTVNAFNLVTNWSTVHFTSTNTTLTINGDSGTVPTAIPHGTNVNIAINVTGSGTPTGTVSLLAGASPAQGVDSATLSSGSAAFSTNLLPGGTYAVTAEYSGAGTGFGPSTSNPVTVTVVPEMSKTTPTLIGFNANGAPFTDTAPLPYGSAYILRVDVTNSSGTSCSASLIPCPTGTVTLTDSVNAGPANPLNDFDGGNSSTLTNGLGFLEDQPIQLPVGTHSIIATYHGDPSYTASVSAALAVTITKAATATSITGAPTTVASGTPTLFSAFVDTSSSGLAPSGTVSFFEGSTLIGTGNCVATTDLNGLAAANVSITATLSGLPILPQNPLRPRRFILGPGFYFALSLMVLALLLSRLAARKRRALIYLAMVLLGVSLATVGCGGGSGGGGGGGGGGTKSVTITAVYNGDANYTTSTSGGVTVTVN